MVNMATVREMALSFPGTDEYAHFDKIAFRVKKKIFASVDEKANKIVFKLSVIDQSVFCVFDKTIIYPLPGAWGKKGWTRADMKKIRKDMFRDILTTAYNTVASK